MSANVAVKKPRVIGIVILSLLGGVLGILGGIALLAIIAAAGIDVNVPASLAMIAYLVIFLGVVDLLAAVLLLMYKRIGLYLAGISYIISVLLTVYNIATGNSSIASSILSLLIDAAVLYYVYIYLTREPDKTFFS